LESGIKIFLRLNPPMSRAESSTFQFPQQKNGVVFGIFNQQDS
jgi:hypothetical protein